MELPFEAVFKLVQANKASRDFPRRDDRRCVDGWLWPTCQPSFTIDRAGGPAVFTVGSCFARNIEEALMPMGFELPTRRFVSPPHERGHLRPNGALNEFNPGTMAQRILCGLERRSLSTETIVPSGGLVTDLLLLAAADVTFERALERRQEIADVYQRLASSPYLIITLGLVESWFDHATGIYLNRMPPVPWMKAHPTRYSLRRLDESQCCALLEPAIAALVDRGVKVLMTVSPVPLQTTFSPMDAVVANESSKAALRVCADRLCRRFRHVDYFPSYEIVRSGGLASYEVDNVHVERELVHRITSYMIDQYCAPGTLAPRTRPDDPVSACQPDSTAA